MRRRGLSLLELVLALGLSLLVLALGVLQTRPLGGVVDSKATALIVTSELRAARARAVIHKVPVAVVVPSQGGTYPLSRSLYVLEGTKRAKIVRGIDLTDRKCFLFVGSWPVETSLLRDPSATTRILPPPRTAFTLEGWPRTPTQDYTFMFTPDGKVLTNDLPAYDGNYHLLVASQIDYTSGARPPGTPTVTLPPAYFNLTGVKDPITLTITPSGSVSMKPGIVAGAPVAEAVGPQALGSAAVTPASMPNTVPELDGVAVYPEPVDGTSDGFDAVLPPDGQLSLKVRASDPDGDPLTCEWTATPITTTQPGKFSIVGPIRMSTTGRATTCIWMPPPNANTGDEFQLTCSIKDDLGAELTLAGNAAINVMVRDTGTIVFQRPDVNGQARLWKCCGDGTAVEAIYTGLAGTNIRNARLSANGSKLVFQADPAGNSDLYFSNRDGSGRVAVRTYDVDEMDPSWSPNGTWIVYSEAPPPAPSPTPFASTAPVLRKVQADKKTPSTLLKAGTGWAAGGFNPATQMPGSQPAWSKDGKLIAFISTESGKPDLWVVKDNGTGLQNLTNDDFNDERPRWAPDSDTLMWLSDRTGVMQVYTLQVSNPTSVVQRTDSANPKVDACFSPRYSPTGGQVLLVEDDGTKVKVWRADMQPTGLLQGLVDLELPGLDRGIQVRPDWGK